jgi:ubiquinone/menaquinone biosynthesis C-methylase UbiE
MIEQTLTKPKTIFLDPKSILKKVGIKSRQYVADLGCGGGYFILAAARAIGDDGIAYAVDVLPSALSAVASRARLYGLFNVRTVWSNVEVHGGAPTIKDHSVDTVLMIQLLSQSKKHEEIFKEATRMARDSGVVLVVDWRPGHGYRFGPPGQACLAPDKVKLVAQRYNWQCTEEFEAGPYHYGLIFKR